MEVILDNDGVSNSASPEDLINRSEQIQYEDYDFKFGDYINKGFKLFFKRPGEFLLFFIVSGAIQAVAGFTYVGSLVVAGPLAVGWFIVAHKVDHDLDFTFSNFFDGFRKTWPLILSSLLVGLSVLAGIILLIIPGIFIGVALMFAAYPVYFNNMDVVEAMKVSYRFIKKKWFHFFGFVIVLGLINIGGLIALGIGLFITVPATYLALYAAYQDIIGISNNE